MGVFSAGTPSYLLPPLAAVLRPRHNSGAPPQSAHPRGCLQPGPLGCGSGRWGSGPSVPWLTGPFLLNAEWVWAVRAVRRAGLHVFVHSLTLIFGWMG